MYGSFTSERLGMTFRGNMEVLSILKKQARTPDHNVEWALSMPPGGQQGVYATGIAQAIHEQNLTTGIDTIVASSAGAGSAYYLIAGADKDETTRKIAEKAAEIFHTRNTDNEMVKLSLKRPVLDIKTLAVMFRDEYPIDPEVLRRSKTNLLVGLTDWDSGEHVVMNAAEYENPLSLVVASMLLAPLTGLPHRTVKIGGRRYLDGGVSRVVPDVSGYTHYLAIVPQPLNQRIPEIPGVKKAVETLSKAGLLPKFYNNFPRFIKQLNEDYSSLANHAETERQINGTKLAVISPTQFISPLSMNRAELLAAQESARQFTLDLLK